jgi:Ni/Fe-hydrogenase subunit HybB-like protein
LGLLTSGTLAFNFWVGEILLGAAIPAGILLTLRWRKIPWMRMLALGLVVGGVVAYRWDTNLVGQLVLLTYLPQEIVARYTDYAPSLIEYLTGAGIVAYGLLAFTLGVRYLNVVDHYPVADEEVEAQLPLVAGDRRLIYRRVG